MRAFLVLGLVFFPIPRQEISLAKRLRSDLFCVEWDVKPQLSRSITRRPIDTARRTFVFAELVGGGEAGGVVGVVRFERDSEEVAIGHDVVADVGRLGAAPPTHLTVHQFHVEIGKLDVVALRVLVTAAPTTTE